MSSGGDNGRGQDPRHGILQIGESRDNRRERGSPDLARTPLVIEEGDALLVQGLDAGTYDLSIQTIAEDARTTTIEADDGSCRTRTGRRFERTVRVKLIGGDRARASAN